ncbi:response regulator [Sediminibacterium ginsengisoli]|uniref:Response regulator receiver domain-containing protein n=1 Tax=Sediminibacterium ginsengisoli TaxID=413434 RepID=A0A1T4Q1M7_9BACT|nr:response regulator [Sediminibacterium ginsengisoli]SJZ97411.1 Response regulator receiver domain-containing protein [Sediminibacterium ginsengisoli]
MKRTTVLIAEDDADDRFLLQTAFDETGASEKIEFVENGVELINHLNQIASGNTDTNLPSFILLDLNMPKKDGREALKEIKENPSFRKIPVIIFSTTKNELEVTRCYDLGANTYIVKPVSFDSLLKTIREIRSYWLSTATIVADE